MSPQKVPPPEQSKSPATEESWWLEAVKTVGLSLFLAFGIRTFVAEARFIPSGSMEPTLQIDDRLIVDKVSYRFRDPVRGDIVVFNPTPVLQDQGFQDAFIKRVIGLPGDQVSLENGEVYVNEQPLQESYVANGDDTSVQACGEEQTNIRPYLKDAVIIPEDQYLVLGDNRHNSYDGRCWGLVSRDKLVGRAVFRFWPFSRVGVISD
ncbi:signal peptidase I [Synechococcales cyanobacterium C]|uniref:Signal peptidase I n=1 Tax=Petrachloros mirabilis ULC683 TaxID=2781853 RepID=A0A8K2AGT3_9CYAN|nr:signal peptidase I [Petrachloros mirabilis]NCJ05299.1 signal peptidase I [Petrachloros mirabilis ULC683]